jgi:hypothetical protein
VVLLVIARVTSAADERPSVLRLMERARSALLGNRAHEACSLLTRHGRRQALGFRVDFNRGLPRTCVAMVKREWKEAHIPRVNVSWPSDLRHSSFTVVRLHGAAASVRLRVRKPYGPRVHFRLRKTSEGWRIDDSDAVPQGH